MFRVYQLSNVINLATKTNSKFLHIDGLVYQYYKLSIYLSIPTRMPPIAGLWYLLETICLYYSWKLNFQFEFEIAKQQGFEPGSQGPKAAILTIELHSIDYFQNLMLKITYPYKNKVAIIVRCSPTIDTRPRVDFIKANSLTQSNFTLYA